MAAIAVHSLIKVATVSADAFRTQFLRGSAFLNAQKKSPQTVQYVNSLYKLVQREGTNLTITESAYTFTGKFSVQLFDIKVKQRFEDETVERICREWKQQEVGVCPLRRGICIGLINDESILLAVGNVKIFYSDSDNVMLKSADKVLLCEKANGEYTMLSSTTLDNGMQWLTFGSKNVRLALPFDRTAPERTLSTLDTFAGKWGTEENAKRFSYLREMIPLWLEAIKSSPALLEEMDVNNATLVGEQVGVHTHIYAGYKDAHIRLFASLPHDKLTTHVGCNLEHLRKLVPNNNPTVRVVDYTLFNLPAQRNECIAALNEIASGSMLVHGEGVVVYVYNNATGDLLEMFKYKCEEYAFDRKLRTLLAGLARELGKAPVTRLRLREECMKISTSLTSKGTFQRMDASRKRARLEMIPALIAFLDRHQATSLYCNDFADHFTSIVLQTELKKQAYSQFAQEHFMQATDAFLPDLESFLQKYNHVKIEPRAVEELAQFICETWRSKGGFDKFPLVGIAASVGAGKTAVLREVQRQLNGEAVFCDRDAFVIDDPHAPAHMIHQKWIAHMTALVQDDKKKHVVLVGNTFGGGFANQLEKQTKAKVLLFVFPESAMFQLECLRRLAKRNESFADGSTLTMQAGSHVVVEKFFSFNTQSILNQRMKQGSVVVLPEPLVNARSEGKLKEDLTKLHKLVLLAAGRSNNNNKKQKVEIDDDANSKPKVPRPLTMVTELATSSVQLSSILPTVEHRKQLWAMANAELIRTDCHLTLHYKPSKDEIDSSVRMFGKRQVAMVCTHKCTVQSSSSNATLQVVVLRPANADDVLPLKAHITLGSSDFAKLPSVTSKKVLDFVDLENCITKQRIKLDGDEGELTVMVEKCSFEVLGKLVFYLAV